MHSSSPYALRDVLFRAYSSRFLCKKLNVYYELISIKSLSYGLSEYALTTKKMSQVHSRKMINTFVRKLSRHRLLAT